VEAAQVRPGQVGLKTAGPFPQRVKQLNKRSRIQGKHAMPMYEFKCECGEVSEELVRMGTETIKCPKCGRKARKILSNCTFSLKGGGWYADGYAAKKKS
jgi:putative FmdB family regulatory protein